MGATVYPIPQIISIARQSQYLAADDKRKKTLLTGNYEMPKLPRLLYIVRRVVQYVYANTPNDPNLPYVANYLLALCGRYGVQANGKPSGIIVVPSTGSDHFVVQYKTVQFQVGNAITNPLLTVGQSSFVITDPNASPEVVKLYRSGSRDPQNISTTPDFTTTFAPGSITINLNVPAQQDEIFIVDYPYTITLTYQTPTPGGSVYTAQTIDVQTETLLNGNGVIFLLGTNTYNYLNIVVQAVSTDLLKLTYTWQGIAINTGGVITLIISQDSYVQDDFNAGNLVSVTGDNTNHGVAVQVTGVAGKTINWYGVFQNNSIPI